MTCPQFSRRELTSVVAQFAVVGHILFSGVSAASDDADVALALLRGVELARTAEDTGRLEFDVEFVVPPRGVIENGVIEFDGSKCRSEVTDGRGYLHTVIRDGNELYAFLSSPHADVEVFDFKDAAQHDFVAFDPRTLGFSDIMGMSTTVTDCLWLEGMEAPTLLGKEQIRGVDVWHVNLNRGDETTFEYWIEEPSFRVHRVTHSWGAKLVEIDSEFDDSDQVFPSRVVARRHAINKEDSSIQETVLERIYTVRMLETGTEISPDRFSLASIDLPINTAINDYRISRIAGYWDGEGISPQPSFSRRTPPNLPPVQKSSMSLPLLVVNAVVVFVLLFMLRRHRHASRAE